LTSKLSWAIDQAKRVCRACPVQAPCLTWALDHGVATGVWGGTTEDERRTIRRARISGGSQASPA
jgi:WhiB family redox-sensing transcriptional regulator